MPDKMRKLGVWVGFSGIAIALGGGCSAAPSSESDLGGRPAKQAATAGGDSVSQADTTGNPGPDCNRRDTPHSTFVVRKHTDKATDLSNGYWRAFPNANVDATVVAYESNLWSTFHTNGYEYLLRLVASTQLRGDQKVPQYKPDHYFFGVGIRDQIASPPYVFEPAPVQLPNFQCWDECQGNAACYARLTDDGKCKPYKSTDADYQREYAQATDPATRYNPGSPNEIQSQQWTCATVLDEGGNVIDFFVLMDDHDPHGDPW